MSFQNSESWLSVWAAVENRKHYWNHIYTWAVGSSHHLNDSNFQRIWINVTNAVFSSRIGCLHQLAQAASQCATVDGARASTLIPLYLPPAFHIGEMVSTSHHTPPLACPHWGGFVFNAIRSRWLDLGVKTKEVWASDLKSMIYLKTNWLRRKENGLILCGVRELWKGRGISEVASGTTLQGAQPALDIPITFMKND